MTTQKITEANIGYRQGKRAVVPEGKGAEIDVRLMGWEPDATVVEGSSGDYPVAAIVRDFAEAFPIGTRMRANHDGFCDAGGNIERIMAKTTTVPERREDGMYAKARVKEGEATDFLRQFADVIGTSVSVGVELAMEQATDDDGQPVVDFENNPVMRVARSERGAPIVERFLTMMESPYNSVDFVEAPGADGAIVSIAIEAAKSVYEHTTLREAATFSIDLAGEREKDSAGAPPQKVEKESMMDEETIARIAKESATAAVAAYVESQSAATPDDTPTLSATVEAVVTAGLSEEGRAEVYERIDAGTPVAEAITRVKALEDAVEARVTARLATEGVAAAAADHDAAFDELFTGYTKDEGDGLNESAKDFTREFEELG